MTEREEFERKTKYPDQIDFKLIISRYTRYWYFFLLGLALALSLAVLYLLFTTPQYRISSSILIRDANQAPDYTAGSPGFRRLDAYNQGTAIPDEMEALGSTTLMERVMADLALYTSYYVEAGLRNREIYGEEVPIRVEVQELLPGAEKEEVTLQIRQDSTFAWQDNSEESTVYSFGQLIRKPYGTFTVTANLPATRPENPYETIQLRFHTIRDLAIHYNGKMTIAHVDEDSNILNISILDPVPEKGKDIVNKLIELYNLSVREERNRIAHSSIEFIDSRLKDLTPELREAERRAERFRRENQVTDIRSEASGYLQESQAYDRQLSDLNIRISVLQSLERYLAQPREQYDLVPSNLNIDDPTLLGLIQSFNDLQLERERIAIAGAPDNPILQRINEQLANLRVSILENLRVIREGLLVNRGTIARRAAGFRERLDQIPAIERQLEEINRELGVMQDLYSFLLQKREESALSLAATTPATRIIYPAIATRTPVEPNKPIVMVLAVVLGLGLPFGIIFLKELLDTTVKQKKDVNQLTVIPVLGEVAHLKTKKKTFPFSANGSPLGEQLKLIRSNLSFELADVEKKVILITSGRGGEGKTFFCINLGASISKVNKKVVLLGFDLRLPALAERLGLSDEVGITHYLASDTMEVSEILQPSSLAPNLWVIGSGPVPAEPAELMLHPRAGHLITALKEQFDYILIDTAPVGLVADALALAPYTDLALFIVRYNYTPKNQLETIHDFYTQKKFKKSMIVLNDARKSNSRAVGYGQMKK